MQKNITNVGQKQMDYPTKVRLSIQKLPLKQRKKHPYVYHFSSKREAINVTTEFHTRLRVQGNPHFKQFTGAR